MLVPGRRGESRVNKSAEVDRRAEEGADSEGRDDVEEVVEDALGDTGRADLGWGAKDLLTWSITPASDWAQVSDRGKVVTEPSIKWIRMVLRGRENVTSSVICK